MQIQRVLSADRKSSGNIERYREHIDGKNSLHSYIYIHDLSLWSSDSFLQHLYY